MSDDGLPPQWTPEQNRAEFLRWIGVLIKVLELAPPDPDAFRASLDIAHSTRDYQDLLARLAERLGYEHAPIERRSETVELVVSGIAETQDRYWIVAIDPLGGPSCEMYYGWAKRGIVHKGTMGGTPLNEFRSGLLLRLRRWEDEIRQRKQ